MITQVSHLRSSLLIGFLVAGCSGSNFSGGNSDKAANQTGKKSTSPVGDPESGDPDKKTRDGSACSQKEALTFNAGVVGHKDRFPSTDTTRPWATVADILESKAVVIPLDSVSGNVLPIKSGPDGFKLDDIAILVAESVSANSLMNATSSARTFTIPNGSIFLYDANNLNDFAEGYLNSTGDTTYLYEGKNAHIAGGQSMTLKQLYTNLGIPLVPHNSIKISDLESKGFVVGNELRFKFVHVAHGFGEFNLQIDIPKCP